MKEHLPFRPTTPLTPPEHGKEAVVGRKGRPGRKTLTPLIIPSKGERTASLGQARQCRRQADERLVF